MNLDMIGDIALKLYHKQNSQLSLDIIDSLHCMLDLEISENIRLQLWDQIENENEQN